MDHKYIVSDMQYLLNDWSSLDNHDLILSVSFSFMA